MQSAIEQLVGTDASARLLAFSEAVRQAFPGVVRSVLLFGSRARGEAQPDSDYDVAVVLANGVSMDRSLRCRLADVAWQHVVDGYAIIPIALQADELTKNSPMRTELGARISAESISLG